ncbi:adenine nucleotide alpha hydrolase family protein [Neoaquamicrobium sediminum]|uniref:hypothetical protein n=1 Tax=Neoaquamicrobium sediminum TaxID=1849104 RepID=UPI00360CADEC
MPDPLASAAAKASVLAGGEMLLPDHQRRLLRAALSGRLLAACFGAGVDSTAMLVALKLAGLRPDIITFANLEAEKPPTLLHVARMNDVLAQWDWEPITVVRKQTLPGTGYSDLYGNCMVNETLPSLAFGMKSCSIKWKQKPQDQIIKGCKSGPNASDPHPIWLEAQARGQRIVKLIGYDCGRADLRRSRNLPLADADFDFSYPLQILGWDRGQCIHVISETLGPDMVPIKSACFFCPASKIWELFWLAAHYPELLERALLLERNALTGRHSRFTELEFGASWEELVRSHDRFPSTSTTVGLGRSFAWNQWARTNNVVDDDFRVRRGADDRARFISLSDLHRREDNALDIRRRPDNNAAPGAPLARAE